jgi:hypothetical protein
LKSNYPQSGDWRAIGYQELTEILGPKKDEVGYLRYYEYITEKFNLHKSMRIASARIRAIHIGEGGREGNRQTVEVKWAEILLCILEVPHSNFCHDTIPRLLRRSSGPPGECRDSSTSN